MSKLIEIPIVMHVNTQKVYEKSVVVYPYQINRIYTKDGKTAIVNVDGYESDMVTEMTTTDLMKAISKANRRFF